MSESSSSGSSSSGSSSSAAGSSDAASKKHSAPSANVLQPPTGTRDFYPAELNRLRYIHDAWRKTSINHGFDEIDGPTFEHLELYTIKSGEGIVSELFSFERFGGEKTFALRPEFTPTLARMYASKANSLPKPTKWFWQQNCFRAERPQRGRLREFSQWNCDIIGDGSAEADVELISTCVGALSMVGLSPEVATVRINDRKIVSAILSDHGLAEALHSAFMNLLDRRQKLSREEFAWEAGKLGIPKGFIERIDETTHAMQAHGWRHVLNSVFSADSENRGHLDHFFTVTDRLAYAGLDEWWEADFSIARGLAYYTGMVFEVIVDGERAVAGGGRYDKLIEMFGGPPTPAVGFGMGDVVLSLVLQDKGLMPSDDVIAEKLGLRPDALVLSNGTPEADAQLAPTLAALRAQGLHARRSYKATKNVGKLIQDAAKMRARFCVILESGTQATVKNMDVQGSQESCAIADVVTKIRR